MTLKELNETQKENFFSHERLSRWIGYFLIVGMMVCFGATSAMLVERFNSGESADYLLLVAGLAAAEGIITQGRMRRTTDMNLTPMAYAIVEWVVMALVVRVLMYFWLGWEAFLGNLASIRVNFVFSFLTGDFIFAMLIALVSWVSARMYTEDMVDLGEDKVLLMIRDGEIASNRALISKRITGRVLAIGFGLVLMTAFANLDSARFNWDMFQVKIRSVNLIIYFVMGLLLMSLAHFAALRAAWAWERIPIDAQIGRRWVTNSLLLLSIIGIVAFLLPAQYSIGLFEAASYIIYILTFLVYGIFAIIQLPIFAVISLFSSLFRLSAPRIIERMPTPPPLPTQTVPENVPEWSLILRSILFWTILVIVIVFAFVQFIRQNQGVIQAMGNKRGWRLILQAFAWLRDRLGGLRSTVSTMVENGTQLLVNLVRRNRPADSWNYLSLRSLTPQQRIRFYYLALIRRSTEAGLGRKESQTPYEYAQSLSKEVREEQQDLDELTESFIEARYSNHTISTGQASRVRLAWEHLRNALKKKKNVKNG